MKKQIQSACKLTSEVWKNWSLPPPPSFLPEDQMYRSFLLDKNGKIILVVNPLENNDIKQLWNKLVKHNIR